MKKSASAFVIKRNKSGFGSAQSSVRMQERPRWDAGSCLPGSDKT